MAAFFVLYNPKITLDKTTDILNILISVFYRWKLVGMLVV